MAFWKKLGKYALKVGKYAVPIALGMTGVGIPAAMAASAALSAADKKASGGTWKGALLEGAIGAASGYGGGALGKAVAGGVIKSAAAKGAAAAAAKAAGGEAVKTGARLSAGALASGIGHGLTAMNTYQGITGGIKEVNAAERASKESSSGIGPSSGAFYNSSGGGSNSSVGSVGSSSNRRPPIAGGDEGSSAQPRGYQPPSSMTAFGPREAGRSPFMQQANILARNDSPMAHMMNQGRRDAIMSQPYRAGLEPIPEIRDPVTNEVTQRPDTGRPPIFPMLPRQRLGRG